jgi:branched-chain amino acid transport system substrate-binding protein
MIEVVQLDNAMKAEKTTQQVKKAIDMGIRFITQGIGSNHALNIIKTLDKHNKRNPDQAVVYFNHSAVTPAFTNEMCSFWHFRTDADVDMKIGALVTQIGKNPKIKKLYTLNQNYAYGKAVQTAVNRYLPERAPNVKLVGDDLMIPFGKVLDFTPYVAKIAASKADAVITGNWGSDFERFVKAVAAAGLDVEFYSIYAGIPTSLNNYGEEAGIKLKIKQISEAHMNDEDRQEVKDFAAANLKKYGRTWYADRYRLTMELFAAALNKAGSDDPVAVAYALEGLTLPGPNGDKVIMRADNHQIAMPLAVSEIDTNAPIKFVYNNKPFGIGWKTVGWVSTAENTLPTTCQMKRPPKP